MTENYCVKLCDFSQNFIGTNRWTTKKLEPAVHRCSSNQVFTGKHLCWKSLFNKVTVLQTCNFIKKETPKQVFSCEIYEICKNLYFFYRTPPVGASTYFILYIAQHNFYILQKSSLFLLKVKLQAKKTTVKYIFSVCDTKCLLAAKNNGFSKNAYLPKCTIHYKLIRGKFHSNSYDI